MVGEQGLLTHACDGRRFLYQLPFALCHHEIITAAVMATTVAERLILGLDPSDG